MASREKPVHRFRTYDGDIKSYEAICEQNNFPVAGGGAILCVNEQIVRAKILGYALRPDDDAIPALHFNLRLRTKHKYISGWFPHLALMGLDLNAEPFRARDMHNEPRIGAIFWKYIYTREILAVEPCVNTGQPLVFYRKTVAYTGRQNDPPPDTLEQWRRWAWGACLIQLAPEDREDA